MSAALSAKAAGAEGGGATVLETCSVSVPTPALLLDVDALEENIRTMAERSRASAIALRPHVKTHKCSALAKQQLDAGAIGLCCATIDEAEAMDAAGLGGLLITSPLVSRDKIARLVALARKRPDIMTVVDHADNVDALAAAGRAAALRLRVAIDLDVGQHRTGVASVADALALAYRIRGHDSLVLEGLQAYAGHLQHVAERTARTVAAKAAQALVAQARCALEVDSGPLAIVTGSGTGTHDIDSTDTPFTELQVGSYLLMDEDYGRVAAADSIRWPFRTALFLRTTVVSTNVTGFVTTDAGTKAFALNGPPPRVATPGWEGAVYSFAGDEHGRIELPVGMPRPSIGTTIDCVVSHVDPTVNLHDCFHAFRDHRLVARLPIDARARRSC